MLVFLLALSTQRAGTVVELPHAGARRGRVTANPISAAPTPRTAERKPDLSGVWMHAPTPIEEMKRLFGPVVDQEIAVEVPGMEISTVHKYGVSVLADFAPGYRAARTERRGGVAQASCGCQPGQRLRGDSWLAVRGAPLRADQDRAGRSTDPRPL
jgi:hypothetical protein